MNVYDFDNTIYDGESVVDFFIFLLGKKKHLSVFLPIVGYVALLYKLGKIDIQQLERLADAFSFVVKKNCDGILDLVKEFWVKNSYKLKQDFLMNLHENDVIITATPNILINGICSYLGTKNIICSDYDLETGKLKFLCMGENKVVALKKRYPNAVIKEFFTDSLNDMPLINMAENAYFVRGRKLFPIKIGYKIYDEKKLRLSKN